MHVIGEHVEGEDLDAVQAGGACEYTAKDLVGLA
jgi:hypothetical protein